MRDYWAQAKEVFPRWCVTHDTAVLPASHWGVLQTSKHETTFKSSSAQRNISYKRCIRQANVLTSPIFKRNTCKSCNYLFFLPYSITRLVHYLFFHLLCLNNIHCSYCLTSSISGSGECYFLSKQKTSLESTQKHQIFQLTRN